MIIITISMRLHELNSGVLHLDSLILKHHILLCDINSINDKVNHLAKIISYFTFSSKDYITQITVAHYN
jgi:hypothetical protein